MDTKHIIIVMGVAGCGKSTVAAYLAKKLGFEYIDADIHHSEENKQKMKDGCPLTDSDRYPWLKKLREVTVQAARAKGGVVLACSALKVNYRNMLRGLKTHNSTVKVIFVYLKISKQECEARVAQRQGHYMGIAMVESQFEALEQPNDLHGNIRPLLEGDIITVGASRTKDEVCEEAFKRVWNKMKEKELQFCSSCFRVCFW